MENDFSFSVGYFVLRVYINAYQGVFVVAARNNLFRKLSARIKRIGFKDTFQPFLQQQGGLCGCRQVRLSLREKFEAKEKVGKHV